jgi:fused signal recognition particle receptor
MDASLRWHDSKDKIMIFWKKKNDDEKPKVEEQVAPTPPQTPPAREGDRPGETWVSRLGMGLAKSSAKLTTDISDLLTKSKLDDASLEELEDVLIQADLGPKTAARIVEDFSANRFAGDATDKDVRTALATSMAKILEPVAKPLEISKPDNGPFVILVCGVNGVGKTTTIGKMAQFYAKEHNKKIMLAAGDTFRAAAVAQLNEWANRAGASFFGKGQNADAAAVAYEAYAQAKAENVDMLFIDTAGRLHNKSNLMQELQKIVRVLKKQDESLPHAVILVLDATTGQNAFEQLRVFKEMIEVTGLAVTKLDGSAKGGVLIGLADQFGVPVHFIGIGEQASDLRPFTANDYANSLMGL